jgi:hypothetical protein
MMCRRFVLAALLTLAFVHCGTSGGATAAKPSKPEPAAPTFLNRVWQVVEASDIALGTYYVFLSDNTLLVTAPGAATPTLGRWHFAGGGVVIIEGGYRYPADILEASAERLALRLHRPGGAVDVRMAGVP